MLEGKAMKHSLLIVFAAGLIACASPLAARADVTVYSSAADYFAALASDTAYTFSRTPGQVTYAQYTLGPLTFTGNAGLNLYNYDYTGSGLVPLDSPSGDFSITLNGNGATALGFELGAYDGYPDPPAPLFLHIGGNLYSAPSVDTEGPPTFFGITSTTPITSLSFNSVTELQIVRFDVGAVAAPEPSSEVLLAMGSIGLGGYLLRRRAMSTP